MLAGMTIAWKTKKQVSMALSTTKAEYYMFGIACQEAVWIRQLCQELFMTFNKAIHNYSDNTGEVVLSDNPVFDNRSISTFTDTSSETSFIPNQFAPHTSQVYRMALTFSPRFSVI